METSIQQYPKAMYLHPNDKTLDAHTLSVDNPEEQKKAEEKGYTAEPFVKQYPEDDKFDSEKQPVSQEAIKKEVAEDKNPKSDEPSVEEKHEADEAKGLTNEPGIHQGVEPGELPATGE